MSSFTLKVIAIFIMLVDHIGAILMPEFFALRAIGRLAFPIFAFLITEGYLKTKNIKKYIIRLSIFAIISEIPFDLAFQNNVFNIESQNVFFTLAISVVTIYLFDKYKNKPYVAIIPIAGILAAQFIQSDYAGFGVILIFLLYLAKGNKLYILIALMIFNLLIIAASTQSISSPWRYIQAFSMFSFFIMFMYNGERGKSLKYMFYIFYPVHLLILYSIKVLIV